MLIQSIKFIRGDQVLATAKPADIAPIHIEEWVRLQGNDYKVADIEHDFDKYETVVRLRLVGGYRDAY